MKRTVPVARTAHDLTHVNRLRVPEFGIVKLCVRKGAKASKSYLVEWAPKPAAADAGSDDFHFVPEKETVEIFYELDDRFGLIGEAKLELFCRFRKKPLWTVQLDKMGDETYVHGKHALKWDGRVVSPKKQEGTEPGDTMGHDLTAFEPDDDIHEDFPDGYITLENTPYKLKLTVTAEDDEEQIAVAWTYFHILVKKIEFELGPEESVPSIGLFKGDRHKMDIAVRDQVETDGGVPASGAAARRIYLTSNLYKTAGGQMNDNTGFDVYKSLWDEGPRIPIFAKIRLAASDDTEVQLELGPGAKALGNTKFLWDWEDVAENAAGAAQHRVFVRDAINYCIDGTDARSAAKNHTYPKGDNCHVDRGGKRGPDAEAVFVEESGYKPRDDLKKDEFPFKVENCVTRKWAVFSRAWTKGKLKGRTGVLFRPSRMGGDSYKLVVYAAWEKKEDGKYVVDAIDEPLNTPAPIKAQSGPFEVWRKIHIARYMRKKLAIADFVAANLGAVQGPYAEAFLQVENVMAGGDNYEIPTANYNDDARDCLAEPGNQLIDDELIVDGAADHSSTPAEFLVRTFAQFRTAMEGWFVAQGMTAPNAATATTTWLTNNGMAGAGAAAAYCNTVSDIVKPPGKKLVDKLKSLKDANDGVTIVQFNFIHSVLATLQAAGTAGLSITNGSAIDVSGATRNRCCFVFWNARVDTFVHEIGHHLFLPHSPFPAGSPPGGSQAERHDAADSNCMMSYNRPRPSFCGLCQLRLRGWDSGPNDAATAKLKKTSASNKRP